PGLRTGVTVVLVQGTDRAMLTAPGTIAVLTADDVDRSLARQVRHVHVSSYFLHTALRPGLAGLFQGARAGGASTSVDPNWDPAGGLPALLADTGVLLLNAEEARRIGRADDVEAAARALSRRGTLVVVKLGGEGALAVAGGRTVRSRAHAVDEVDAIGAGDSF